MTDITTLVPPSHHYRVTLDFWTMVNDTTMLKTSGGSLSASNLIFTNFLSVSLSQGAAITDISITCIPIELFFQIKGTVTKTAMVTKINSFTNGATKLTDTAVGASNKWIFTRCAYSYQHAQAYVNQVPATALLVPQMYSGQTTFSTYVKKFYAAKATVNFVLEGFSQIKTAIYVRNINVFREYLPQTMNLKYL